MDKNANSEDAEVQRLKNLVKDLEQQNNALRTQKINRTNSGSGSTSSTPGNGVTVSPRTIHSGISRTLSESSDRDDGLLDLSDCGLDDDVSW